MKQATIYLSSTILSVIILMICIHYAFEGKNEFRILSAVFLILALIFGTKYVDHSN